MIAPLLEGLALGAGLIIAIGAQNAFVLRQGLLREHVFILCLICSLSDAVLIALGVGGVGSIVAQNDTLIMFVTVGGVLFLGWYAIVAFRRAWRPHAMQVTGRAPSSLKKAVATCLAFTFLNPHVYLDTVLLVGSLSARYEADARLAFATGAMLASFIWFFGLGYGARLLQPVFARPAAWRVLDALIGCVMTLIAVSLVMSLQAS